MRLLDLEPQFVIREVRLCPGREQNPECHTVSPHTEHEYHVHIDALQEADGVTFLCPKCFAAHGNSSVGTHWILCWRPRIPDGIKPGPGRWEFQGTGLHDLTLVAGSSSVQITGGCEAHFHITNGEIVW